MVESQRLQRVRYPSPRSRSSRTTAPRRMQRLPIARRGARGGRAPVAHRIVATGRAFAAWQNAVERFWQNVAEYLTEEAELLARGRRVRRHRPAPREASRPNRAGA